VKLLVTTGHKRKEKTSFLFLDSKKCGCSCVLQFEEQKDNVSEEQVMRVVFLDPENPNSVSPSVFFFLSGSYRHHLFDWDYFTAYKQF